MSEAGCIIAGRSENLTVTGESTVINTTNMTVKDSLIELNSGITGTNSNDCGILIDRGTADNAFMGWDSDATSFLLATTTATAEDTGNLANQTVAALSCGAITATSLIMPDVTSGKILVGNGTSYEENAVSGDVTMTNSGVVSIGDEKVTLAKIANAAANTVIVRDADDAGVLSAKAVATTEILIGDGTGFTAAALSGDVTMTNAGVVTIEANAVETGMILDANVTLAKIANAAANTVIVRDADDAGVLSAKAVATTEILIGDGTGFTAAALSGDVTMTNAGVVTISAGAVGVERVVYSAIATVPVAQGNVDTNVTVPANGLITDMGFIITTAITATTSNTLTIDFGTSAGGADFVAAVQVNATSAGLALGTSASVLAGNKAVGSGTVFAGFVDGVKLYDTSAEVVNMRLVIGGADLTNADGRIRQFVKYIVIS